MSATAELRTMSRPWQDYVLLLVLSALLASNFMMTKISVAVLPPLLVVTLRLGVAALILCSIMLASGYRFPKGRVWIAIFGVAVIGHVFPFTLIAWGQQRVDAGVAAILMATMPLFTLLLAQIFTRDERPNRYSTAGFALALFGIVVLFGPERLLSLADLSLRQYAIVGAAMCYGTSAIITKSLLSTPWQNTSAAFMFVAFLISIPMLWFADLSAVSAEPHVWAAVFYTGFFPTALGAVLIVLIISRAGAAFSSQINFVVPVFGALFAIVFLGESLPANGAIALIIILAGVALARRRPKRKVLPINRGV